jgi:predicted Zn-dependent protease
MNRHNAKYQLSNVEVQGVSLYFSPVTITIEKILPDGLPMQENWLVKQIDHVEQTPQGIILYHRSKDGVQEKLILENADLQEYFRKTYARAPFFRSRMQRLTGTLYFQLGLIALFFAGMACIAYFWVLPFAGEKIAMQFSREFEIKLGEEMYSSSLGSMRVDSNRTAILNEFFRELHYPVAYPVSITVVESEEINAFAIPGGHIVVYSGILERMRKPEQLAALLGHESAHIAERHSLRNLFRSLGRNLFLLLFMGNNSGLVTEVAGQLDALKGLQYSRTLEYEADDKGMDYMSKSRIDPSGMLRLMEMLQKETKGTELPGFLQTHPLHEDRIAAIRRKISGLSGGQSMSANARKLFHEIYE